MQLDGAEVIAHWREAGAWWEGEAPQEIIQWQDLAGIRREKLTQLPPMVPGRERPKAPEAPLFNPNKEDISLRPRKIRDEKVTKANGFHPESGLKGGALPWIEKGQEQTPKQVQSGSGVLLHSMSGLSFGRSCLLPAQIAQLAAARGYQAAAITDRFSLAGAAEFVREAQKLGVHPLAGAAIELEDYGGEIVLLVQSQAGWRSLSRLITQCHLTQPRLFPLATWQLLAEHREGLICLSGGDNGPLTPLILRRQWKEAKKLAERLMAIYGKERFYIQVERSWHPWQKALEGHLNELARHLGVTCCGAVPALHADPDHFPVQDAIVCAHTLCTVEEVVGRKPLRSDSQPAANTRPQRGLNAERYLLNQHELWERYQSAPHLLEASMRIAESCTRNPLPPRPPLPRFCDDPEQELIARTYAGAKERWGTLTRAQKKRLEFEFTRIIPRGFSTHFLIAWDLCQWAQSEHILYSGRGSVVDSLVAYCLGLTRIDALEHDLHFDRFLPEDGSKRPDIDLDFEAARRDDARNYLVDKYGRDKVATVAAFGAYCSRGIIREVGKMLEIPTELISWLSKRIHGGVAPDQMERQMAKRPELVKSGIPKERLEWIFRLAKEMMDIPRSIRAHSSGVVLSSEPLCDTVPVQLAGNTDWDEEDGSLRIIQWDKRSAKYWFDKLDILCLRGQDVLAGTERRLRATDPSFRAEQVSLNDPETYRTMRGGELIGIPQSASPAMRQAHMRLQTENLTDASLVQAGIRPGVGGAVKINELIARRRGLKPFEFEHPDLEDILGHTYGIVVFQEQIDQLLTTFVGCSGGEAEEIREEIHKRRREDYGAVIKDQLIERIISRGYTPQVAAHAFELIAGFKGYGFAQGHALAFAEISVRSIWCQQNHPAEYFAALFDAQPAGYYGPCTLANEARIRGVKMLPPRLGWSTEQFRVEDVASEMDPKIVVPAGGIRVGLKQVSGLSAKARRMILKEFPPGPAIAPARPPEKPWTTMVEFLQRCPIDKDEVARLILAGFFDEIHPHRRALLWSLPELVDQIASMKGDLPLSVPQPKIPDHLAPMTQAEMDIRERTILGLDVERHLMSYEREVIFQKGGLTAAEAKRLKPGTRCWVVGSPIRLRFPPTKSGRRVVFFDLEDETGLLNVTSFDETYQKDGHALICSPYVTVRGQVQWRDGHTAFLASRIFAYNPVIRSLVEGVEELPVVKSDFLVG